ncbi:hypothetical protein KJ641_02745 [Patescibacteria group bacterium]|nr:hypothetical protein [Patescibacteria group bacterium]MBU1895763.1 hypothetical protein [Patescibacteria group bacterium]
MKDILELHEFFVEGKKQNKSHVLLHITEPSTPEEQEKGYFFAVAEIVDGSSEQIEHLQQMIDDLETGYYETEDEEDKNAFEITLEYINKRGHHITKEKKSDVHCLIGVINGGDISFAYHGEPTALVIYQGKTSYETLSVISGEENENQDQLFSAMMQGNIQTNDYFYVSSPQVKEYINKDRLQKIITSRRTREAVIHIEKALTNLHAEESFGGILFHLTTKDNLPKTGKMPAHLKNDSAKSLNKLISSQQETSETLNPPLLGKAGQSLKSYWQKRNNTEDLGGETLKNKPMMRKKRKETKLNFSESEITQDSEETETNYRPREENVQATKNSMANTILIGLGKVIIFLFKLILIILQKLALSLKNILVGLFVLITNKGSGREHLAKQIKLDIERRKNAVSSLPIMSKILFVAALIFAILFVGSIFYLKIKESREVAAQDYTNKIQQILDKKDKADASIIYGDETNAFNLLKEAETLITELPSKTSEEQIKVEELSSEVEGILIKLRKVEIAKPDLIGTLSELNPEVNVSSLTMIDNDLIAYGPDDNNLYVINTDTGSSGLHEHSTIPSLNSSATPKENDITIFIHNNSDVAILDKESFTISDKDISFPVDNPQIEGMFTYNRRIYTLDTAYNQVYKHNPTQTGYDKGAPWITSTNVDLSDAVSLAIDGDLFILKRNGEILKFSVGEKVDFDLSGLDPKLENPEKIWAHFDDENIYVLESTNKRVIILNKEGKLIKQITAIEWQSPTGIQVNEALGIIYILDNNKVYKINI